ncbi:hypothetical protein [Natrinema gelatinilyticum]|uniref:hypothetical protein n=1 Tax=Natrinema gelatinilyticum TaxID=2961571 RepID=UPI0020C571AA|nr:hypothetical protein [Natrinema gelatinilyticum]
MLDREGRIVFGSFLVFVLIRASSLVLELQLGVALRDQPLPSLFLFAGVAVALPQLYLASIEGGAGPTSQSRLRFAAIATAAFAVAFADSAAGLQSLLIGAIGVGSILGLLCYETLGGYRSSSTDWSLDLSDR